MVEHTCYLSTWEIKAEDVQFWVVLNYIPSLKTTLPGYMRPYLINHNYTEDQEKPVLYGD